MVNRILGLFTKRKHWVCLNKDNNNVKFKAMDIQKREHQKIRIDAFQRMLEILSEKDIEPVKFQKKLGIGSQNWNNWRTRGLPSDKYFRISDLLGINSAWLATGNGEKYLDKRKGFENVKLGECSRVTVVGSAQLVDDEFWAELNKEDVGGYVSYPACDPDAYALMCIGDRMKPRIRNGEFLIIEPNRMPQSGDDVAIKSKDGKVMVKTFMYERDGRVNLMSINEMYSIQSIPLEDIDKMSTITGIASRVLWVNE